MIILATVFHELSLAECNLSVPLAGAGSGQRVWHNTVPHYHYIVTVTTLTSQLQYFEHNCK